ncbi:hypothetical protein BJI67_09405 [Acidihalobacter aeolianus]|uniref:Uncharacterized protein n=1 Tax=Acidihalobacter aeolianus TaxID=2792603 RepID=A0A1D8K8I6_9GAMM|nr:hypothetical protein BJI67_09405 [Acidihalobacter aeolianus]
MTRLGAMLVLCLARSSPESLNVIFRSALLALICCLFVVPGAWASDSQAIVMHLDGHLGPSQLAFVRNGLAVARDRDAALVVLAVDVDGADAAATDDIVQAILHSPVPVAGLAFPAGAQLGPAGTRILSACSVAAMAPTTRLELGKSTGPLHTLAERYGRKVDWQQVDAHAGKHLTAAEAARMHLVDLLATDPEALVLAADGRRVRTDAGWQILHTGDLHIMPLEPAGKEGFMAWIGDPNVAFLLLLIGFFGIVFELAGPGMILPGTVGAVALILALIGLQGLPINYLGMGLMLAGIAMMVGESFVALFAVLGLAGVAVFTAGSLLLFDSHDIRVSLPTIGATAAVSAGFFLWLIGRLLRLRRRGAVSGREAMIGARGVVAEDFAGTGHIHVNGELWQASSATPLHRGQHVRVVSMEGLELTVVPEEN